MHVLYSKVVLCSQMHKNLMILVLSSSKHKKLQKPKFRSESLGKERCAESECFHMDNCNGSGLTQYVCLPINLQFIGSVQLHYFSWTSFVNVFPDYWWCPNHHVCEHNDNNVIVDDEKHHVGINKFSFLFCLSIIETFLAHHTSLPLLFFQIVLCVHTTSYIWKKFLPASDLTC